MPRWLRHRFRILRTRSGVPVRVHWSVPAIALFLIGVGVESLLTASIAISAYLAMLLIHEVGHAVVAQRLHCRVVAIEIFPLHGRCLYEMSFDPLHDAWIAWGGAAAQLLVGLPLAVFVKVAGYTRFEPVNAALAILGFVSPFIAVANLLPVRPLDGHRAWRAIPLAWSRQRFFRRRPKTALEAMEEALRKVSKNRRP